MVESTDLQQVCRLYTSLSQILRLCLNEAFRPDNMPPGLIGLLPYVAGEPDVARLESLVARTAGDIRNVFVKMIGTPGQSSSEEKSEKRNQ